MSWDCDNWGHIPVTNREENHPLCIHQANEDAKESGAIRPLVSTLIGSDPLLLRIVVGAGPL
jgi:hypothetical protein